MTISIVQGKKRKTYRVQLMVDGSRVSRSFKTRKEATTFEATIQLNSDLARGLGHHAARTLTFSDATKQYLEQYTGKDPRMPSRLTWWCSHIGDIKIDKIDRHIIKAALQTLLTAGKTNSTCNRYKSSASAVFSYLMDEHDLLINPARQVKQLKEAKGIDRYLSKREFDRLMAASKESNWNKMYLLVLMAITTGARRSELIGLQWRHINFKAKTAYLGDTKNGDNRVLPLIDSCIEELEKFKGYPDDYIFHVQDSPCHPFNNFDKHWYACLASANVQSLRFHDLRHTCASWLAMNGAPLKAIAEVLGHKTIVTTARYTHHSTEHKASMVNNVFGGMF